MTQHAETGITHTYSYLGIIIALVSVQCSSASISLKSSLHIEGGIIGRFDNDPSQLGPSIGTFVLHTNCSSR